MSKIAENLLIYQITVRKPSYQGRCDRLATFLRNHCTAQTYVSFSAGKDSSVLAHAAHAIMPGIPIVMVDPGVPTHWTAADYQRWMAYIADAGWNFHRFPWDKWQAVTSGTEQQYRDQIHTAMFSEVEQWAAQHGYNQVLMGLRAAESKGRRRSLSSHGEVYTAKSGRVRLCPLGLWTEDDIWAYIVEQGLPWLDIYDKLGPAARNGMIGKNGLHHGRMAYLRHYFPEAYRHARDVLGLDFAR